MKDWLKDLDDKKIKDALNDFSLLDEAPAELDNTILNLIEDNYRSKKEAAATSNEERNTRTLFQLPAFSMSLAFSCIILIIIIPLSIFLVNRSGQSPARRYYTTSPIPSDGTVVKLRDNKPVASDDPHIQKNDIIKTQDTSGYTLEVKDNFSLAFGKNTELKVISIDNRSKKTKLNLSKGQIMADVDKTAHPLFQIETDQALVTVIGTRFVVERDDDGRTLVAVNEGTVKVSTNKRPRTTVFLTKGQCATIHNNRLTSIDIPEHINNTFSAPSEKSETMETDINEDADAPITISSVEKIYTHSYPADTGKNKILGITGTDDYIIAYTEVSLLCLSATNELQWKNTYGEDKGLFFMSRPVIADDYIYFSSLNQKLLVLDLKTGKEIDTINMEGNLTFGYQPVTYGDDIIIPLNTGIYTLTKNPAGTFETSLLSPVKNTTTPTIYNDAMYLTSFVENTLSCYTLNGTQKWQTRLGANSLTSPVVLDDILFAADYTGTMYTYTLEGSLVNKKTLSAKIVGKQAVYNRSLFSIADDGFMYQINIDDLSHERLFRVDNQPDKSVYLYKSPLITTNSLLIGNDTGEIMIYDFKTGSLTKSTQKTPAKITASLYNYNGTFYTGTENGEIYRAHPAPAAR